MSEKKIAKIGIITAQIGQVKVFMKIYREKLLLIH